VKPKKKTLMLIPDYATMTVSQVRQTMVGKNSLQAPPGGETLDGHSHLHHNEVKAAAKVIIQRTETLLGKDGVRYHMLYYRSDLWYVWDGGEIFVEERRTNFWDDKPTDTEVILSRPLRSWAMPDGMWRPYDMHPDTFEEHEHGCAVQMLYRGFTKQPSGAMHRAGITGRVPMLTIDEINAEMDISFAELNYTEGVWPFHAGWRKCGVNTHMIFNFCDRRRGRAIIFHGGHKTFEHTSPNWSKHSPVIVFCIHGDHAYDYKDGKQVASHVTVHTNPTQDEYTDKKIREPCPSDDRPPFSTWLSEYELFENMHDGFLKFVETDPVK
jgi:hypothetical protein